MITTIFILVCQGLYAYVSTQLSIWFFIGSILFAANLILLAFIAYQIIHKKNIALLTAIIVLKYAILFLLLFFTFDKGPKVNALTNGYLASLPIILVWGIWEGIILRKDVDERAL